MSRVAYVNAEPLPSSLVHPIVAPIASHNLLLMARPRPDPQWRRFTDTSTCEKRRSCLAVPE